MSGLTFALGNTTLAAGRASTIAFAVTNASSGAAVDDLEPYLGAAGHLLIVSDDLEYAIHAHPSGATTTPGALRFDATLPRAGVYKMWLQVQRGGEVITVAFVVRATSTSTRQSRVDDAVVSNCAPAEIGSGSRNLNDGW